MPGCPVDGEDECLLSGSAFCPHSHHPSAHVHDRQDLLCHGDEMCKYLCVSATFNPPRTHFMCWFLCCNWTCLCCSWTQMMPKLHLRRNLGKMCKMSAHCREQCHVINVSFTNFQKELNSWLTEIRSLKKKKKVLVNKHSFKLFSYLSLKDITSHF